MNAKALIFYLLGAFSIIAAAYLFFKWLELKFLIPLALAIAAVVLFWKGSEAKSKK